jgi:hypothetical protein
MAAIMALVSGYSSGFADGTPMRNTIGGGDAWSYEGEVIVAGGQTCTHIPCNFYCEKGVCAHGTGHLGTDGSWWYDGTFVGGQMEGFGRYENDFYVYEGGFESNKFHGQGKLSCHLGPLYEGNFDKGNLVREFRIAGSPKTVKTRILPGQPVGWIGPCEQ